MDLYAVMNESCTKLYGVYSDIDEARSRTGYGATDAIIIIYTPADRPPIDPKGEE